MFIIVLGQHVSILIESSSGTSKKIDPYLKCLKMPNFKTLTGTYERGYTYILYIYCIVYIRVNSFICTR